MGAQFTNLLALAALFWRHLGFGSLLLSLLLIFLWLGGRCLLGLGDSCTIGSSLWRRRRVKLNLRLLSRIGTLGGLLYILARN